MEHTLSPKRSKQRNSPDHYPLDWRWAVNSNQVPTKTSSASHEPERTKSTANARLGGPSSSTPDQEIKQEEHVWSPDVSLTRARGSG